MSASSRTCGTRPTRPSTAPIPRLTCEETGGRAPPVSLPATSSGSPVPHRRDPSRPSGSSPSGTPHFPGPTVRSVCHRCHCRKGQADPDLGAVEPQGCGPSSLPYVVALNPFVATILNRKSKSSRGACDVPPGRSGPQAGRLSGAGSASTTGRLTKKVAPCPPGAARRVRGRSCRPIWAPRAPAHLRDPARARRGGPRDGC